MIKKEREIGKTVLLTIAFGIIVFFLWLSSEQTSLLKTIYLEYSVSILLFVLLFVHDCFWKKKRVWVSFSVSVFVSYLYIKLNNVSPAFYGKLYSKVIYFYAFILCLSFVLIVISAEDFDYIKSMVKSPLFIVTSIAFISTFVYDHSVFFPLIVPFFVVIFTRISRDKWLHMMECISYALYLVFAVVMTYSLIYYPDVFINNGGSNRYLGVFKNLEPAGVLCGSAVIAMAYLIERSWIYTKRVTIKTIIFLILAVYPLFSLLRISSRAVMIGLFVMAAFSAILLFCKSVKQVLGLLIPTALGCAIILAGLLYCGKYLAESGNYHFTSHFWNGWVGIFSGFDIGVNWCIFEKGTIPYAIDYLTAGRLSIWVDYFRKLSLFTRVDTGMSTHNFFLFWMSDYGIVVGLTQIIWYTTCVFRCIRMYVTDKMTYIQTKDWILFTIGFWNFAAMTWTFPAMTGVLFLLFVYPLYGFSCADKD